MCRKGVRQSAQKMLGIWRYYRQSRSDIARWHGLMQIEARLSELGLILTSPMQTPPGARLPFTNVRVRGNRAFIAGHGPQNPDGSLAAPFGKVPKEVLPEQAYQSAKLVTLAMLASLKRELGDLDRIGAWLRVFGMVNSAPDFKAHPSVINGCSDLLLEVFGPDAGQHARCCIPGGSCRRRPTFAAPSLRRTPAASHRSVRPARRASARAILRPLDRAPAARCRRA